VRRSKSESRGLCGLDKRRKVRSGAHKRPNLPMPYLWGFNISCITSNVYNLFKNPWFKQYYFFYKNQPPNFNINNQFLMRVHTAEYLSERGAAAVCGGVRGPSLNAFSANRFSAAHPGQAPRAKPSEFRQPPWPITYRTASLGGDRQRISLLFQSRVAVDSSHLTQASLSLWLDVCYLQLWILQWG